VTEVLDQMDSQYSSTYRYFRATLGFLGYTVPWRSDPQLSYSDHHLYPLKPSARKPTLYRRSDTVLSTDGTKHQPLVVQAVPSLKGESNCTWHRRYIRDVNTITRQISQAPSHGRLWLRSTYGDSKSVIAASWCWYFLLWTLALTAHIFWFVC
jgi:hypothetical protein